MNKRVLITGSNGGIGSATALNLANIYEVALHCRNKEKCEVLADKIEVITKKRPEILIFDVGDTKEASRVLKYDIEKNGTYYGIVLNAGITKDNTFVAISNEEWHEVINTNLNSFYNVLSPVLMEIIRAKKPARIIALGSVSGVIGNRGQSNYSASKAGLIGAVKSLAIELASRNITVNYIAAGLIQTNMSKYAPMEEILKLIPAKRAGKPEEVANLVKFLLSDEAAYITRQVIGINGGLC